MEDKKRKIDALLPLTIALVMLFGIFIGLKINSNAHRRLILFAPQNKVNQTLDFVKSSYVDDVSFDMLEESAIKSILENLDPHSQYIPASDFSDVTDQIEGNFSGIGVQFNILNDTVVVVNTVAKGPSEKIGILSGDRIVEVDDLTVAGVNMASDDIVKMLKGTTGSKVKVGIYRRGSPELLDFTITRDKVPLFSIDVAYMITPETGFIKVNKFSKTTFQEFFEAAEKLRNGGMTKMIVDLRDNSGGIIEGAIRLSELFLPAGKLIVYTEGNRRGRTDYYSKGRNTVYNDIELMLLINETSASASEIVAGAIQDNDRGTIIGRRSYGKGLVQEQYPLMDGSAIRVTVSRYYTPTGRCIQKPYILSERSEYFNELYERYSHGEMAQADSIRFNDSLRYVTPAGKVVYGGGGIMPDIFVPVDTASYSKYYETVMRRGLAYRFALDYVDKNRKKLAEITDYRAIVKYLQQKDILTEFVEYSAKHGVPKNDGDLKTSGTMIENALMAYIARNIIHDEGYYPVLNLKDKVVQKTLIEVIRNP